MSLTIKQIDNLIFNKRKKTGIKKWDRKIDEFFGEKKLNSDLVKEFFVQSGFEVTCDDDWQWHSYLGNIHVGFQVDVRFYASNCFDKLGNCEVQVYQYEKKLAIDHLKFIFRLDSMSVLDIDHEDRILRVGE